MWTYRQTDVTKLIVAFRVLRTHLKCVEVHIYKRTRTYVLLLNVAMGGLLSLTLAQKLLKFSRLPFLMLLVIEELELGPKE